MSLAEPSVVLLSGHGQSGKTTLLAALVSLLRSEEVKVAGILAEGLWENGIRSGFDLRDLSDNSSTPLCRRIPDDGLRNGIPFAFREAGLAAGMNALSPKRCAGADVVIVDEVGFLELEGKGWSPALQTLLELDGIAHVWAVRSKLLDTVRAAWGLEAAPVVSVEDPDALNRLKIACLSELKKRKQGS
jgi:nucleoside-triphosphatase THEP1